MGGGSEGVNACTVGAVPLHKAAAAAIPIRAAQHEITIPQIAPVDKPLLLFFIGIIVEFPELLVSVTNVVGTVVTLVLGIELEGVVESDKTITVESIESDKTITVESEEVALDELESEEVESEEIITELVSEEVESEEIITELVSEEVESDEITAWLTRLASSSAVRRCP